MIDVHADDYALTINTSEELLGLMREGLLDSISIIANMSCYDRCMESLMQAIPELPFLPKLSVHINLVEGLSLSGKEGALISDTWKSLFFASFIPRQRSRKKELIKKEIALQTERSWADIKKCMDIARTSGISCVQNDLRIDSHQHTHMIPVVRDALLEYISESGQKVEYIRNSKEPLMPFLSEASLIKTYRIVNIIKNRILYHMSYAFDVFADKEGFDRMYLWGLVMSGKMDPERVRRLYEKMSFAAAGRNRTLEILFHPGRMEKDEKNAETDEEAAASFYLSNNRDIEKDGVRACYTLPRNRSL